MNGQYNKNLHGQSEAELTMMEKTIINVRICCSRKRRVNMQIRCHKEGIGKNNFTRIVRVFLFERTICVRRIRDLMEMKLRIKSTKFQPPKTKDAIKIAMFA